METAVNTPAQGPVTLYHRRHAKMQRSKSLGHMGAAVVLVLSIMPILTGVEHLSAITGIEVAVGIAYLVLMVRELLHLRHNPFHRERVAWLELAGAAILALESYHVWHRHHLAELAGGPHRVHFLPYLFAALAAFYVWLAFNLKKLDGRRFLHLHSDGFAVRTKHLGKAHTHTWAEIASIEPSGPTDLLVKHTNGQSHHISFADVHNGAAHRDQLLAHYQLAVNNEQ